jgi:hypothetical protein
MRGGGRSQIIRRRESLVLYIPLTTLGTYSTVLLHAKLMESGNVSGSSQVWTGRPVGSNQGRMLPAKTEIFPLQTETYLHQWRGKKLNLTSRC